MVARPPLISCCTFNGAAQLLWQVNQNISLYPLLRQASEAPEPLACWARTRQAYRCPDNNNGSPGPYNKVVAWVVVRYSGWAVPNAASGARPLSHTSTSENSYSVL